MKATMNRQNAMAQNRTTNLLRTSSLKFSLLLGALFAASLTLAAESEPADSPSREPANIVVPVPQTTVPRSAVRESDKETPVAPTEQTDEDHLTGNWGGRRKSLSDRGIDLAIIYKQEVGRNLSGGLEVGSYSLGNLDLRASLDTEKMNLWKGGTFFFYGLFNNGADPSSFVGDNQVTSNLETAIFVSRLYEAWYQHALAEGKASLLIGLHDLNSEFYVTDSSTVLFNSSFGVGRELSQTGVNGPSIFPVTAPAVRFRAEPSKEFYLQTAVFNAVAGNPDDPNGTHLRLSPDDGLLLISEVGFQRASSPKSEGDDSSGTILGKIALGTWSYTHTDASSGTYILIDQALTEQVSAFVRAGFTAGQAHEVESNLSGGLTCRGLLPSRENDIFAVGATSVSASATYRAQQESSGTAISERETTIEVSYRAKLFRGVFLQPDYQYVDHPDFSKENPYAQTLGARLELNF
jgi:porin